MLFGPVPDGAFAVIVHVPTPVVVPLELQGPIVVKVIGIPELSLAFGVKLVPYWMLGNCGKFMTCGIVPEFSRTIANVAETGVAAL